MRIVRASPRRRESVKWEHRDGRSHDRLACPLCRVLTPTAERAGSARHGVRAMPDNSNQFAPPDFLNPASPGDREHLASFECILNYTIPIVSVDSGNFIIGGGVLVEIQRRLFVATAWHCIEAGPVILVDGMTLSYRNGLPVLPTPQVKIVRSGGDPKIDIGYLELESGKPVRTRTEHVPCTLEQLHTAPIPVTHSDGAPNLIHVVGWPAYTQEIQGTNIFQTLEGFITDHQRTEPPYLYFGFGERGTQWNESRGGWEEKPTPSPHGFSGGGCWGILKSAPDSLYDPTRQILLFAIQRSWDRATRVARAVLISEWLKLLHSHFPDLRNCLESKFPGVQFQRA